MIDESASARTLAADNLPLSESPEPVVKDQNATESVRIRLIKAALDGVLADDYHHVTTRRIAQFARRMSMTFQMNAGAVRRFAKAMRFGAWLQSITERMTPAPFRLVQIGSAYWQSKALYVAAKLDLATVLGTATLTASALASRVGANEDALGRLMRLLAAMGIFETAPMVFRNNKLSRCLASDDPQSVRAMILMHNSETMSRPWFEQLEAGIRSGATVSTQPRRGPV
jgi:hypothetical protein